jgi:TPR repeat protein
MDEAYLNIGNIYARNNEYSNAFYYWQKATEHGSPSAHRNIGIMFYNGLGCNINYEKANNHFEKASKDTPNDPLLLLYQGLMYKYGNGTNQNLSLAKEFLKKAADKGNEDAQREYAEIELSN